MPAKSNSAHSATTNDAFSVLTADHEGVKKMYKQYRKLMKRCDKSEERRALAQRICTELTVHATVEEEILYPALRAAALDSDMLDEADVEHASAKALIAQIESMSPNEPQYDAKVTVLCEYVGHHVKEEEGQMFPKARRAKGIDLVDLGAKLMARKTELIDEAERAPKRKRFSAG